MAPCLTLSPEEFSTDDVSPHELDQMISFDMGIRFDFYPFGEVIDSHEQKFHFTRCWRQWFHYVDLPREEWPQAGDRMKIICRGVDNISELMAKKRRSGQIVLIPASWSTNRIPTSWLIYDVQVHMARV